MFKMQIGNIFMEVILFTLLCICSVFDIRKKEIPLIILIAGILTGVGIELWQMYRGMTDIAEAGMSLLPGAFFILLSFCTGEKVGYGDGLLLIMSGLFLGFSKCFLVLCISLVLASAFALILLVFRKAGRDSRLPLVPFITVGMGVSFFV